MDSCLLVFRAPAGQIPRNVSVSYGPRTSGRVAALPLRSLRCIRLLNLRFVCHTTSGPLHTLPTAVQQYITASVCTCEVCAMMHREHGGCITSQDRCPVKGPFLQKTRKVVLPHCARQACVTGAVPHNMSHTCSILLLTDSKINTHSCQHSLLSHSTLYCVDPLQSHKQGADTLLLTTVRMPHH